MHDTLVRTAATVDIVDLVDVDSYPIHRPTSDRLRRVVDQARVQLMSTGCLHLPGLVRPSMLRRLSAETNRVAPDAYTTVRQITPYGDDGTGHDDIPEDHPRRWAGTWSNGFVGKDRIPADSLIRILYDDEYFRTFIADCLGLDALHQFFDPIRGLVVNVMGDDTTQAWHYDANEFVVSLMTRRFKAGGTFEYCPNLREIGDEHYDEVARVLGGDRSRVRVLDLEVGDLQLFRGRYSLHRVAPTVGERHTVLFGFSETPGYIANVKSTLLGYGRVTQAHIDADTTFTSIDGLAG
jgi:hypothetical protein